MGGGSTNEQRIFMRGRRQGFKEAAEITEDYLRHYPKEVFPDPVSNSSGDRYAAAMARHLCTMLSQLFHEECNKTPSKDIE